MLSQPGLVADDREYIGRRRWQRFQLNLPVSVVVTRGNKTTIVDARGTQMSAGGLAVFTDVELRTGDPVFIEFRPPFSSGPVLVRGVITNRTERWYGVAFHSETPEEEDQLLLFRDLLLFACGGNQRSP